MKVFVSWSGKRSKTYALHVHDWIRTVVQRAEPWMSEKDILPGQRWNEEISVRLRDTNFGIICLTPENITAPWLLFEAGALAKAVEAARVVPLLFGLKTIELTFPLAQFQAVEATRDGFLALAAALNRSLPEHSLDAPVLNSIFNGLWPTLSAALESVEPPSARAVEEIDRSDREILEEVLDGIRGIQRSIVTSSTLQQPSGSDDWEDYYLRGVRLANAKEDNIQALLAYSSAISLIPDNLTSNLRSRLFAYRAAILKRLGRLSEARMDLELAQTWATEPREVNDAIYNRACVAALEGDKDLALNLLQQLLRRDASWRRVIPLKREYFGSLHGDPRYVELITSTGDRVGAA